jgi:hypothetical protein
VIRIEERVRVIIGTNYFKTLGRVTDRSEYKLKYNERNESFKIRIRRFFRTDTART